MQSIFFNLWDNHSKIKTILKYPLKNNKIVICGVEEYEIFPHIRSMFTEKIKKQLKKNNNRVYFCFGSAELDKYTEFDKFKYHCPNNNTFVFLWPTFWINRTVAQNINFFSEFFIKNYKKDFSKCKIVYPYICMNNVAKYHRCLMIDLLAKESLLDKGAVSWRNFHVDSSYKWKYTKPKLKKLSDFEKYNSNTYNLQFTPPDEFNESFMSIVTETTTDIIFITEKTATALLYKQPFVVQGAVGFHGYLKTLGFELYDEIFDYSFDQEIDLEKRTKMIIDNVKSIADRDLYELYSIIKSKLNFNHNRMIEISQDKSLIPKLILDNKHTRELYHSEIDINYITNGE